MFLYAGYMTQFLVVLHQYHIILRLCILTTASYTMFGGFPAFSIFDDESNLAHYSTFTLHDDEVIVKF